MSRVVLRLRPAARIVSLAAVLLGAGCATAPNPKSPPPAADDAGPYDAEDAATPADDTSDPPPVDITPDAGTPPIVDVPGDDLSSGVPDAGTPDPAAQDPIMALSDFFSGLLGLGGGTSTPDAGP